jgi:hypothetical protein
MVLCSNRSCDNGCLEVFNIFLSLLRLMTEQNMEIGHNSLVSTSMTTPTSGYYSQLILYPTFLEGYLYNTYQSAKSGVLTE